MELDDESQQGADGLSPVTVKVNTELPRIQNKCRWNESGTMW